MNSTPSRTADTSRAASPVEFLSDNTGATAGEGWRGRQRRVTVGKLTLTIALIVLIAAVTIPVFVYQVVQSQTSRLQTDLSTAATLIITSDFEGNAVPTFLPAGLTTSFTGLGRVTPAETLKVFGDPSRGTLCVEGRTALSGSVWSYNMEDGGLREAACPQNEEGAVLSP